MTHTISDSRLLLPDGKEVVFEYDIEQAIEVNGIVVVVLKPQRGACTPNNVYGVSIDGTIIWQIDTGEQFGSGQGSFFTGIAGEKDGIVYLFHYVGQRVQIDPRDGRILQSEFTK